MVEHVQALALKPSILRPACKADTTSYGSGIRKFHIFCDTFSVSESERLPASFRVLHSFALWASTDPDPADPVLADGTVFEPVSVSVVRKYLAAVQAWRIVQGWPPPLAEADHDRINFSLRGIDKLQNGKRRRPPRPPIRLSMLTALKNTLILSDSFDACIWAIAACAFWGMMRFGEVTVKSRTEFNGSKHLKRYDAADGRDDTGRRFAKLGLPSAKTAKPGEIQYVYLASEGHLCPLEALANLAKVVPASADDPLFSWRDARGDIRPMTRSASLNRINSILHAWGWGNAFGHSFRIGGASLFLSRKVDPEIVCLSGRWRSLAYEAYIRAFELVAPQYLEGMHEPRQAAPALVG